VRSPRPSPIECEERNSRHGAAVRSDRRARAAGHRRDNTAFSLRRKVLPSIKNELRLLGAVENKGINGARRVAAGDGRFRELHHEYAHPGC
jgi:hypothetical protein